ncbi:hypothetical protein COU80_01555 [Candidatus Peregrinibacteria bacterium CG10_big_fil_rev_8_21_14_0_10_55_24]|nr:MAG: hypothetical protein COU80_01555 [Candidatus Peregrinibacteria bacterium CG10_big_fil_rev_8_21_14_0_10_55_24]
MIAQPFRLFRAFPELTTALFVKADAIQNDRMIADRMSMENIAGLEQVHGNTTIRVEGPIARTQQADGVITNQCNLVLTVRTADCQSFVAYAPMRGVIGVLHVGWRGLIAGAIPAFFAQLHKEWGITPQEVLMAAGPSLCTHCAEFTDPIAELPAMDPVYFHGRHVDLRSAADHQILALGVKPQHLERQAECTCCQHNQYWTYRGGDRSAVKSGFANVLACAIAER